jgi:hypothetical protein
MPAKQALIRMTLAMSGLYPETIKTAILQIGAGFLLIEGSVFRLGFKGEQTE